MAKVLIVDDAEFLRVRLTKMLNTDGYEVFQAENGLKAVAAYKELHPDVVLMDVTMPEMDGLTALSWYTKGGSNGIRISGVRRQARAGGASL